MYSLWFVPPLLQCSLKGLLTLYYLCQWYMHRYLHCVSDIIKTDSFRLVFGVMSSSGKQYGFLVLEESHTVFLISSLMPNLNTWPVGGTELWVNLWCSLVMTSFLYIFPEFYCSCPWTLSLEHIISHPLPGLLTF